MTVLTLVGAMLALAALGLPLVFAILGASLVTILIFRPELPLVVVAQLFTSGMDNFPLLAIAFFFLVGELMNAGGMTRRLVGFANALVGHVRGGLGHVGVVTSMLFAGVSGSAVADGAAVGSVLIPSMRHSGYPPRFAAAVIETASVMGPIIPPSIPMIIYAVLAEVSVGGMFVAGIVPGFIIAAFLSGVVYALSRHRGYPRAAHLSWPLVRRTGVDAGAALLAPVIIVGGILGGVFTATEAGAIAVLYTLVVSGPVYRELGARAIYGSLLAAARGTSTVLVILGASSVFGWLVADLQLSRQAAALIFEVSEQPWIVLLLINVIFLLLGMFMDPLAALIVSVPVLLPVATQIGVDPVQFGVIVVMNLMIGLCTPPVGYLIFLTAGIGEVSPGAVIRESLPFLAALLAVLLLCTYVPALTLTLPALLAD